MNKIDLIAYYLPQFHIIPENEKWWGKGFTEWTHVKNAKKLYPGHKQAVIPGILGYYDILDEEIRENQALLAKENGIEAFCYYHYWFGKGRTLLEAPIKEVLRLKKPNFPFCMCWANESWGGVWHGKPRKILMKQNYPGNDDIKRHLEYLAPAFEDKRYYRIESKPFFQILKAASLPSPAKYIEKMREIALKMGLGDLFIVAGYNHLNDFDYQVEGFDHCVSNAFTEAINDLSKTQFSPLQRIQRSILSRFESNQLARYPYDSFVDKMKLYNSMNDHFPIIVPNWDNTPRLKRLGYILEGGSPALFARQLRDAINLVNKNDYKHKIIFIKSWNEWAEGNYLEPDSEGQPFLDVIREINR